MTTDSRFNRILNNLDKVIEKNGGGQTQPQVTEVELANWAVNQMNEWLNKGELVEIVGNRLKLIGD